MSPSLFVFLFRPSPVLDGPFFPFPFTRKYQHRFRKQRPLLMSCSRLPCSRQSVAPPQQPIVHHAHRSDAYPFPSCKIQHYPYLKSLGIIRKQKFQKVKSKKQRVPAHTAMQRSHQCLASPNQHLSQMSQKKMRPRGKPPCRTQQLMTFGRHRCQCQAIKKSDALDLLRLFAVAYDQIGVRPLGFPKYRRKLRIF